MQNNIRNRKSEHVPMSRTLYIHVGPSKTGTTAIQSIFQDLCENRLTYPKAGRWPDGSHNLLYFSINGLSGSGRNIEVPPMAELIAEISSEISKAPHDCLISSEALNRRSDYTRMLELLHPATRDFDQVRPILTLRHPLERFASNYNQAVRDPMHGETALPDDYLLKIPERHLSLCRAIRNWLEFAPNLMLLPYHPASSLVQRFCDLIGHAYLAPRDAPQIHRSLGGVGLVLVLIANRNLRDFDSRQKFFQRILSVGGLQLWQGSSFPFSQEMVAKIHSSSIRKDLEELKSRHGIDITNWSMPKAIALTKSDCMAIRYIVHEHLPTSPELETDLDAILEIFRETSP